MLTEDILRMVLMGSGAVLLVVLAIAAFELIRTLRWVRYTAEDLQPTIKQATDVLEALEPAVKNANELLESLEPAMKRVDPLMERISLTIDAVNLEIMRADQILANLTDVTDVASNAAKKVSTIADTPLNLLTSATDKVRSIFSDKKAETDTQTALAEIDQNNNKPLTNTTPFSSNAEASETASDTTTHSSSAASTPSATEVTPPYQDDIEVIEPAGEDRLQWPF